ncbi:hypothetical protein BDV26DRAFT_186996 [Aspergillus bertholletiae]|uniref:Heterokaryon incompatibility domain-containing protein n=1 Tax=Aspergillus bertholletiae TaxID=1226010 RepID=A0A5N7BA93_9EURO|nr:hypothetical protein BDV26DRAFT_186996 [Aspergillus bertholletiae]
MLNDNILSGQDSQSESLRQVKRLLVSTDYGRLNLDREFAWLFATGISLNNSCSGHIVSLVDEGCRDKLFHTRAIHRSIDIPQIKQWIRACGFHPECSDSIDNLGRPSRLLNIQTGNIEAARPDCSYAALSFRQGSAYDFYFDRQRSLQFENDGGLHSTNFEIPRTIRDAIAVASDLGFIYLWINTLCIPSPELGEQYALEDEEQRGIMPDIYRGSDVTIVATGKDAQVGLYGVGCTRRSAQVQECHNGRTLAIEVPSFEDTMNSCPWNRRRWTFQEAHQSRRLLIFAKEQVFFRCQTNIWTEAVHWEVPGDACVRDIKHRPVVPCWLSLESPGDSNIWDLFWNYTEAVSDYSRRKSARESANVYAFRSYVSIVGDLFHGLPTSTFAFTFALAFEVFAGQRAAPERAGVPSWSFLAWKNIGGNIYEGTQFMEASKYLCFWRFEDCEISISNQERHLIPVDPHNPVKCPVNNMNLPALTDGEMKLAIVAFRVPKFKLHVVKWTENEHPGTARLLIPSNRPSKNRSEHGFSATLDPKYRKYSRIVINGFVIFDQYESFFLLLAQTDCRGVSKRIGTCDIGFKEWDEYDLTSHLDFETLVLV